MVNEIQDPVDDTMDLCQEFESLQLLHTVPAMCKGVKPASL